MTTTEIDPRNLPPVPEAERPVIGEGWRPSQTFLKLHDRCDRAAMLYLIHRTGAGTHPLNRGGIFHDVIAELTELLLEHDENRLDSPEIAKDALIAHMDANPELQVEARERDDLRHMVANWALGEWIEPAKVLAVETTFVWEVGGFEVVGRIDRAEDLGGGTINVIDYKTAWAMPDAEEFRAQAFRDDGTPRFGGDFQTMLYACAVAFGTFEGGLTLGEGFERFKLDLRFPRYLRPEGLGTRSATVTRAQLLDFRLDIESQLRRLREVNLGEGRWQPTTGAVCEECPAEYACPLPRLLRPDAQLASADLATLEERAEAAVHMERRLRDLKSRIKKRAIALEEEDPAALDLGDGRRGIRAGKGLAYELIPYTAEKIRDKDALLDAAARGERINIVDHVRTSEGTKFEKRKVPTR